jgi:predicted outer membrane repeat protein
MWLFSSRKKRCAKPVRRPVGFRPQLEVLESRCLLSASFYEVMTPDDSTTPVTSGTGTAADPFQAPSLRSAIVSAQFAAGAVISFDPNIFATAQTIHLAPNGYSLSNGPISFGPRSTAPFTINGPTDASGNPLVTIDGDNSVAVESWFQFFGGKVTFSNLKFADCLMNPGSGVDGGVFSIVSGQNAGFESCTFQNCIFDNNTGAFDGGAIADFGPALNLQQCSFSNNSAVQDPFYPGVSGNGGAIFADGEALTITGSTFSGNSASGSGGAIASLAATTNISSCTVNGNSADFQGGGVYIDPSVVTILSSTISGNSAPVGADVYNLDSSITMINSTLGDLYNNGGTVTTPDSAVTSLDAEIATLTQSGTLTADQAAGLTSKLQAARQSLNNGKFTPGVNQLNAFINQVNAFVKSHTLTSAQAQPPLDGANELITAANAGGARLLNDTGTDTSTTADTQPVTAAGELVTGPVGVYLDNADGTPVTADEKARFDDAIAKLDATFGPYGVLLVDVGVDDAADAVVQVEIAATSAAGSAANGVLGCTVAGHITLLTGWNWFTGAHPSAITAGQYDFETIVMHELGHAIGLGHSGDSGSVMYAYLSPGQDRRSLTVQDLSVLESATGAPEPLLAAGWQERPVIAQPSASAQITTALVAFPPSELSSGALPSTEACDLLFTLLGAERYQPNVANLFANDVPSSAAREALLSGGATGDDLSASPKVKEGSQLQNSGAGDDQWANLNCDLVQPEF